MNKSNKHHYRVLLQAANLRLHPNKILLPQRKNQNSFLTLLVRNIEQRLAIDGYLNDEAQRSVPQDADLRSCLQLPLTDEFWFESMQLAAVLQRFEATGSSITSEKVPTLGMYCFATRTLQEQLTRMPLSYFADMGTKNEKAVVTWRHEELCQRIVKTKALLYTLVDARWDLVEAREKLRTMHCWLPFSIRDLRTMQYGCNARNKWEKTDS